MATGSRGPTRTRPLAPAWRPGGDGCTPSFDDKARCDVDAFTFETCDKSAGGVSTNGGDGLSCGAGLSCSAGVCE